MKAIQKEGKELEKSIKPIKDQLQTMGTAMVAVGGAVVGSFVAMAKSTADYGDKLNDARQRTGATVQDLAKLGFAAEQSGSSFEGMSTGLKFLAKNMEDASSGGKESVKAFKALGVSAVDARGKLRPTSEVMLDVAERFSKMEDGADKTAVAMKIFGKSGADLIPTLNAGRAGIEAMGNTAERLGMVISKEAAMAADEFNDRLAELTSATKGVSLSIGTAFIPILTTLFQKTTNVIVAIREWTDEHPDLIRVIGAVAAGLTGAGGLLLGMAGVLTILPQLTTAFTLLTGPVGLTVAAVAGLVTGIVYFRNEIASGLLMSLSLAVEGFSTFIGYAARLADAVGLDGVAGKLRAMSASTAETSNKLTMMGDSFLETTGVTIAQTAAVTNATRATRDFTLQLDDNTEATKKAKKEQDELVAKLKTLGNTYETGLAIERSLGAAHVDLAAKGRELKASLDAIGQTKILEPLAPDMAIAQMHKIMGILQTSAVPGLRTELEKIPPPVDNIAIAMKRVQDATADVKRSAGEIFDAMFIKGENVFSSLANLLKGGAMSLGRAIFEDIAGALLGPIKAAFDGFFEGLLVSTGIKSFLNGIGERLGSVLGGVLGIGSSAASGAAGAAGGAAQTAIGSLTTAANFASGGLMALGAGIGSFVGNLAGSLIGGSDREATEYNTRATWTQLIEMTEQCLNPMKATLENMLLQTISTREHLLTGIEYWGSQIVNAIGGFAGAAASAYTPPSSSSAATSTAPAPSSSGPPSGQDFSGLGLIWNGFMWVEAPGYAAGTPYVPDTGLAMVHKGERIIPAGENRGGDIHFTINQQPGESADDLVRKIMDKLRTSGDTRRFFRQALA